MLRQAAVVALAVLVAFAVGEYHAPAWVQPTAIVLSLLIGTAFLATLPKEAHS